MSRIGKAPVYIPKGVEASLVDGLLVVKGSLGVLTQPVHPAVSVAFESDSIRFGVKNHGRQANAMSGTLRAIVGNMVSGVAKFFEKKLILVGVGYKAQVQGSSLNLALGFSHPIIYPIPSGIKIEVPTPTEIVIKGVDKQVVGQVAAEIRSFRSPEPYKGKGVRYADERIVLKETKKK